MGIAFADTILAGLLAYGTGSGLFPHMIANSAHVAVDKVEELKPFFEIKIPAMVDVMSALVFSFIAGLGIAHKGSRTMQKIFQEFKEIVSGVIAKVIIPLLPLYIFGIFLGMTFSGEAYHILLVFAQIILVYAASLLHGSRHLFFGSHHSGNTEADPEKREYREEPSWQRSVR